MKKMISMLSVSMAMGVAVLTGCASNGGNSRTEASATNKPSISITAPSRDLLVGDTATFVVNSMNTYGRDAKVKWSSTGGKITTEDNGQHAKVRFDETGTYTVKATLEVDGNPVQTEAVDVRVRPVK